jgi:DNA-binding transcriptional MerR regulator
MTSLNDLAKELKYKGYKVTPRTIKYYIEVGLLPKPTKQGGYREGVRLVYADKEAVLARLINICQFKGRGYKLAEIAEIIKKQGREEASRKHAAYLKRFKEIDGQFYFAMENAPDGKRYQYGDSLKELFSDPDSKIDVEEVERRGFFKTPYRHGSRVVYDLDIMVAPLSWIELKQTYGIEWDILERLFKKHTENYSRFVHWPNPDGVRFSDTWVGYHRQWALNFFGCHLVEYVKGISAGFLDEWDEDESLILDYKYTDIALFLEDFLLGNCVFVPPPYGAPDDQGFAPFGGPSLFLKKLALR